MIPCVFTIEAHFLNSAHLLETTGPYIYIYIFFNDPYKAECFRLFWKN